MIINQQFIDKQPFSSLPKLALHIKNTLGNHHLVINAELLFDNKTHTDLVCIEIVKHLRIVHQVVNPIVVTGFLDLQYILAQHPEHIILTSPGTRYLRLPYTETELAILKATLQPLQNLQKKLAPYIRADFNIEQFGHSFANRFGLYFLEEQHKKAKTFYTSKASFSENELYQFEKARFIYDSDNLGKNKFPIIRANRKAKILFIDDQAAAGWSHFINDMFASDDAIKLRSHIPELNATFLNAIKHEIKNLGATGIILDLRLYGDSEKDVEVEKTSGFKVLKMIKSNFPSLPVLMFSATNKAESLKKLLDAGALNLYTKPRIEENNALDNSYKDLIKCLNELVNYYELEEEKIAVESDYLIHNPDSSELTGRIMNYLHSYDRIYTDTNCWMIQLDKQHILNDIAQLNKWLYITALVSESSFVVIVDIQRELLVHQYTTDPTKTTLELAKNKTTAAYGLRLLNKLVMNNKLFIYDLHKINAFGHKFQFEYNNVGNEIWQKCLENGVKLYYRMYDVSTTDELRQKLKKLNKRRFLYADDAFINIIHNDIENPFENHRKLNVLLVSEDVGCVDNLYSVFTAKYPNITAQVHRFNTVTAVERVQEAQIQGVNSYGQNFEITLMNPFTYLKKLKELSAIKPK
jgi:CheY-like chemotaxis protein